jgi:hypothetical protein
VGNNAHPMPLSSPQARNKYTINLEDSEISLYTVSARTRDFEPFYGTLETPEADDDIDFKSLARSTNTVAPNSI